MRGSVRVMVGRESNSRGWEQLGRSLGNRKGSGVWSVDVTDMDGKAKMEGVAWPC